LRVLIISFIVLVLPLLIYTFIFSQTAYYRAIDDAKKQLSEDTNLRTFALAEMEHSQEILLEELEYLFDLSAKVENLDPPSLNRELAEIAHLGGDFKIYVLDVSQDFQYKIIASNVPDLTDPYFISHLRLKEVLETGKGAFVRYTYSEQAQNYIPHIFIAQTIESKKTTEPIGIIMIVINIQNEINAIISKKRDINFAILNPDGIVVGATQSEMKGEYFYPLTPSRREEILASGQIGVQRLAQSRLSLIEGIDPPFLEFILNDEVYIAYSSSFPKIGISVVAYAPKKVFFSQALHRFLIIYFIFGLIVIIGGGIAYWLSFLISRPLTQLSNVMEEVSRGNLEVRFKKEPLGFEINLLGAFFNQTIDNLLENIKKAEDEKIKKETYEHELAIGRKVQQSLFPSKALSIDGAELGGAHILAKDLAGHCGGWMQRKTQDGEEVLMIDIGTAAGKGLSSCLYALSVSSLVRAYSTLSDHVADILAKTNRAFLEDIADTNRSMTLFLGMYYPKTQRLCYYSCGHVPPIVRQRDGQLLTLTTSGVALGLLESKEYQPDSIQLHSGDIVLCFTDGLMKAIDEKRFYNWFQQGKWPTAKAVIDDLLAEIGPTVREEEITLIVLKVT